MKSKLERIKEANDVLNYSNPAWKEEINWLIEQAEKVKHYEKELTNLINDERVPLVVGYWISLIIDGEKHKFEDEELRG